MRSNAGLILLAALLAASGPPPRADMVTLGSLLDGGSIEAAGVRFDNFRSFGPKDLIGIGSYFTANPDWIRVAPGGDGLVFTGDAFDHALLSVLGQNPTSGCVTFDATSLAPGGIVLAGTRTYSTVNPSVRLLVPEIVTSLTADDPVLSFRQTVSSSGPGNPPGQYALLSPVRSVTLTASFEVTGASDHGFDTRATLNEFDVVVSTTAVPEPSTLVTACGAVATGLAVWWRGRRGPRK